MKHIRLFDKKDGLMQAVTTNPSADYPVIALCKNEDELSFWNTPIIKAKYNITSGNYGSSCIGSDYNIKSLTIDGELKFKKDTWVKYEYQLTQDDFQNENSIVTKIYVKLNNGCRNVYLKSDEKATQFLLIYPGNSGGIDKNFINIEETKESLFIKQIDEYTYDLTNFYLYYDKTIYNENTNLAGVFLADSEGNALTQNLEFECFEFAVTNEQIAYRVTQENAFNKDIFFGGILDISVDTNVYINENDYLYICVILGGEMLELGPFLISETTQDGLASLSNNILHIDISRIFGSESALFCVIIDKLYGSTENNEDLVKFVKNCTITGEKKFIYTPILSVGEHDVEVELLQHLYTPYFVTNALVYLDMSHVNGKYIHIKDICSGANELKQVYLPNNLNSIGSSAFNNCGDLTSVTIPNSVTSIGSYAFNNCSGLTSVIIPNRVTSIGYKAFRYCSSLTSVSVGSGVTSIGDEAFTSCKSLTSVAIPNSVTTIGSSAFYDCTSLTSVNLGSGVTSIGSYAFNNCSGLTSVIIPNRVTSIGDYAFKGCYFQRDKFIKPNSLTSDNNWGATLCDVIQDDGLCISGETAVDCKLNATSVTIGSGVTTIGDGALKDCRSLTSVTIGNNVTSIGSSAFNGCFSLTQVNIPDSVTSIGDYAFSGCTNLTLVTIGNGVTNISPNAFIKCSSLTSVTIGNGVTSISYAAFSGCTSLTSITIPSSVKSIRNSAFSGCERLSSITIPDSVTSIDVSAFYYCTSLTSVTIPSGVTSINNSTFSRCTSLTSITIPDSVTNISHNAFSNCTSLTSVTIGSGVTSIYDNAFGNCSSLTSVTIPNSLKRIRAEVFQNCTSLTSVIIGSGVSAIDDNAFSSCTSLTSVTCYATTAPSLSSSAFSNISTNGTLYVPNGSDYSSWLGSLPSGWTIVRI